MALIKMDFFSKVLNENRTVDIITPSDIPATNRLPILWLLPPIGRNHTAWLRHTTLDELCEAHGVMAVMPDLRLSFGADMDHGPPYFQFLTSELPDMICDYFPADPTRQLIAGAAEGGYAAFRATLKLPGRYRAAGCFSGGCVTGQPLTGRRAVWAEYALGQSDAAALTGGDFDLDALAAQSVDRPYLLLAYGQDDPLAPSAEALARSIAPIEVVARPGILGWVDWQQQLDRLLDRARL